MKKLFIETHGCQMNEYDSDSMKRVLEQSHQISSTQNIKEAHIILLNTCAIREKSQDKVFSRLGQLSRLKKENPNLIIGVGGCVASQEGDHIQKRAPYVDIVFGPQTVHRLPHLLESTMQTKKPVIDISFPKIEKFDCLPTPKASKMQAAVSIMEGCSKYCSFCVVPYTRGEEISRPLDDVLEEILSLVNQGCKEITLLGQNVNDYRGKRYEGGFADLADLIGYIASIKELERIRFITSHPLAFSNRLIQAYAQIEKLADHLHLPVQSGSNRILSLMKRGYTHEFFRERIQQLRKVRPNISISSDFIVGFPGESTQDFNETVELVKAIGFDNSFSFLYSKRPGTPASKLKDNCSIAQKKERLKILKDLLKKQAFAITQNMLNRKYQLLVNGISSKRPDMLSGQTENNRTVHFKGSTTLIGQKIPVKITDVSPSLLQGVLYPL